MSEIPDISTSPFSPEAKIAFSAFSERSFSR
jgi:hypothetical protein